VCDGDGGAVILGLSEGQISDHIGAKLTYPALPDHAACMIGGKGYDSDGYCAALKAKDITPCIPTRKGRILPAGFDRKLYRQQHKSPRHVRQTQRLETCPHPIRSGRTHLHVRYRHSQNRHLLAQLTNPEPRQEG